MVTQKLRLLVGAIGGHTLPETNGHLRVIASHGGKDESHVVGLTLVIARILQILEVETLSDNGLHHRLRISTHAHSTGNSRTNLQSILLFNLRTHLLGRVAGYGMCYLMAQHNG